MDPVFSKRDIALIIVLAPIGWSICGVRWVAEKSWDIITGKKPPRPYKRPPLLPRRPLTPPSHQNSRQVQCYGQSQEERERKWKRKFKRRWKYQAAPQPHIQSQSILFRLLLEVRVMIYWEILSFPLPLRVQADIGDLGLYTDRKALCRNKNLRWTILGLLACCRLVYSESIHLLYETNVLDFSVHDRFASILKLPRFIVPSRLPTFRSVRLHLLLQSGGGNYSAAMWRQVCDVLKTMTGLHSLVVQLHGYGVIDYMVPCLEAMAGINALKFEVYVPRRLSIQGGPNPEVFPHGTPFTLLRANSDGKWEPWDWGRSVAS